MKKEKALLLINNIKERINENLKERSTCGEEIYIKSWVIGSLNKIEKKITTGETYAWKPRKEQTYESLFKEFIHLYFCLNIIPEMKIYTINVLFDYDIRNMIVDLYFALFTKQQIEKMLCGVRNHVGFTLKAGITEDDENYLYNFEYIRRYFNNVRG